MKKVTLLALAALCLTGCWTSIFTVAPDPQPAPTVVVRETRTTTPTPPPTTTQTTVYTTTVTTPTPKTTTVTTFVVTDYNTDPCFYLDLNAVAAAYAESRSTREFEEIINSSRYMINNLDLNADGWIDYLRVIETGQGLYHVLLLQACLAPGIFQDVATVVAERRPDVLYVEVIGDRYLYGYNYIVRPVFVKRPPIWDVYGHAHYTYWSSPYYYDYYPSYYTRPKPVYLNHYQAYVTTYMTNHHYCHHCDYPQQPYYGNYTQLTKPHSRNDFGTQHPDNSFERRVSRTANGNRSVADARNAGQLRTEVNREATQREQSSRSASQTTTRGTSTTSTTTTNRSSANTNTTTTTTNRSTTTTSPSSTTNRTSSTTNTNRTSSNTTTRSASTTSSREPNTTTVETRVRSNGTTRTTVKTTDETGRTQTVKREGTSTRSSSSDSSSRSSRGTTSESNPRSTQRGR